ncbi:MAG: arginine--tRNA ligase [Acidimicrobiia bacterium]|nr:arginine--tRNA ligase [Acidimicrobiia bacterium]MBP8179675.1 arginine--tRNA ligase [Acidimicrobiia bacterium]
MQEVISQVVAEALSEIGVSADRGVHVEPARNSAHGDFATNAAMVYAKAAGQNPRVLADKIVERLTPQSLPHFERAEVAGPGFVNVYLRTSWLHEAVASVLAAGDRYGHVTVAQPQRINLEFVSANPTGPLHVGGARWAAIGDALANLLTAVGHEVSREYYINDAGAQMDRFGLSLQAYVTGGELPEDGYGGQYLADMAALYLSEGLPADASMEDIREWGYAQVMAGLISDFDRLGVTFDTWYSERTLHETGKVEAAVQRLKAAGLCYEADGALWLRTADIGEERDRVLIRSNGAPSYLAADVAYHQSKFDRGFDHLIDIWGADHHGQIASLQFGTAAMGHPVGQPEVLLGQMVTLLRHGEEVRISKRAGTIVTLSELLDEVDPDAARLTFLLQSLDTTQTFDIGLVASQSMDNPVYYVQYAHARLASIDRAARKADLTVPSAADLDLSALTHDRERDLMAHLVTYPETIRLAAESRAVHRVTTWVRTLAGLVNGWYHDCRVLTDDHDLSVARLALAQAAQSVLANALTILGVTAPDVMERLDDDA